MSRAMFWSSMAVGWGDSRRRCHTHVISKLKFMRKGLLQNNIYGLVIYHLPCRPSSRKMPSRFYSFVSVKVQSISPIVHHSLPCVLCSSQASNEHLVSLTLVSLKVVRHLQASPPESALDVEALVRFAAIENGLVTPDLFRDEVERLNDSQTEFLALLVLGDGDILNVADLAQAVDAVANVSISILRPFN
jgi:hypothetical protein